MPCLRKAYYVMQGAVGVQPSKDSTTTMSTKGQLTIPSHIRERLALHPGDRFSCQVADGSAIIIKKLDPVKVARLTIGEEFRRSGITPEQLEQLLEEVREECSPQYMKDHYDDE